MNYFKLFGGIVSVFLGIAILISVFKKPIDAELDVNKDNIRGIVYSIVLIVLGFVLISKSFG